MHAYLWLILFSYGYTLSHCVCIKQTICVHVAVSVSLYCIIIFVFVLFQSIAIDQVTGVILTCVPVNLINQCNVTWNVSNCYVRMCLYACIILCTDVRYHIIL